MVFRFLAMKLSHRAVAALVCGGLVVGSTALVSTWASAGASSAGHVTHAASKAHETPMAHLDGVMRVPALGVAGVPADASYLGPAATSSPIDLDVVLAPSNPSALAQFAESVSTPSSPQYHDFLTEPQFVAEFGPPASVSEATQSWLTSEGFSVSQPSPFVVQATGAVAQAARALGVSFGRYSEPGGDTGVLATGAPSLPSALAGGEVTGIVGLDTLDRLHDFLAPARPRLHLDRAKARSRGRSAEASPVHRVADVSTDTSECGSGGYTPQQLALSYQVTELQAAGQDGAGVTIALPEINASLDSDVSVYDGCAQLTNPVSVVDIDGGPTDPQEASPAYGQPCSSLPPGDQLGEQQNCLAASVAEGEADIDIEMASTLAPGVSIVAYETGATDQDLFDAIRQIVTSDTAKVISISVGQCEASDPSFATSLHGLFEQAASQGQSVVVASGDTGSEACFPTSSSACLDGTCLSADVPASDPLVTAVGGTVLTTEGELAWNDCLGTGNISCAEQEQLGASGGGVTQMSTFSPPPGQPVLPGNSSDLRELPDVSANAGSNNDPAADVSFYTSGSWGEWLGTSIPTPLWGGLIADRDTSCTTSTGDFNPALYSLYDSLYAGSLYPSGKDPAFNPIPDGFVLTGNASTIFPEPGNNDFTQTQAGNYPTVYPIGASYNMVTGIGSPKGPGLACSEVVGSSYEGQVGQQVVLSGLGLENASIYFGQAQATVLTSTATSVTVQVPSGFGTVQISAKGVLGQGPPGSFTYEGTATTSTTLAQGGGPGGVPGGGLGFVILPPTTTTSSTSTTTTSTPSPPPTVKTGGRSRVALGFWMAGSDGGVFGFGKASYYGSLPSMKVRVKDVVAIAPAPGGTGYWMAAENGTVYHFGSAANFGSLASHGAHMGDIVGMAANANGGGYWLLSSRGQVFAFGHARNFGSVEVPGAGVGKIIGIASSPDGRGYWVASSNGTVWHFGDAANLSAPKDLGRVLSGIVAIAANPVGEGYWLVAGNGTIYNFGSAPRFTASAAPAGKQTGGKAVVGVAPSADGLGLWTVTANGVVTNYGDATPQRSLRSLKVVTSSVVAAAAL